MGSVSYHRPKGETNREHFAKDWKGHEVLADSTVGGVWYAAVKNVETGEVFAAVYKTQWTRDYFNFTVKTMDETMGPYFHDAPAKVLDLLTPTDSDYANEWRAKCRETIAAKASSKAKAKDVKDGTVIEVSYPLNFGSHGKFSKFRYTGNKATFVALYADGSPSIRVNLGRDWKSRFSFEIQPTAVTV